MTRFITPDDLIDTYAKINQRGFNFISSKFNFRSIERTKSAFNDIDIASSNWWIIPKVQERWNKLITKKESLNYEQFTVNDFLEPNKNLKMLSLGSGNCSHEMRFASFSNYFETILCIDISDLLLEEAEKIAESENLKNMKFRVQSIYDYEFP